MTFPGLEPSPPLQGFFTRAEKLATTAFLTIPYVGPGIADFFNQTIVPYFAPKRDRLFRRLFKTFRSLEGGLQVLVMRLIPLPRDEASRTPR